jgi:F-type H+-transporting ATPase subunit beta
MKGHICAIHGDVVEIEFSDGIPNINDALSIVKPDGSSITLEVHDHINHTTVKALGT